MSPTLSRRIFLLASAASALPAVARAQSFPVRPVRLVLPYPPGGPLDSVARALAERLSVAWGQPVLVDNKPGANEIIGADTVAKAAPDGHTMLFSADGALTNNMYLYKKLPYDPVRDLVPVTRVSDANLVLMVKGSLPVNTVREFVALMTANPGKHTFASTGNGSGPHLSMEAFKRSSNFDMLHVPYKGIAPAVQDLLGGAIDAVFTGSTAAEPYLASGKAKVLAVSGKNRMKALPNVPTFAQAGYPEVDASFYLGIAAPARTPKAIVEKIAADVGNILHDKAFTERAMEIYGFEPVGDSPAQFSDFIRTARARMEARVRLTGVTLD